MKKLDVLGVDVSPQAIGAARRLFGPHFALADGPEAPARAPFDVIYHVGLIGCVADPIELTRRLLSLLRPGGELLFNAPNRAGLRLRGQLWFDTAPPPDLVTLFPQGFWQRMFAGAATITEVVDEVDADVSLRIAVQQRLGIAWRPPVAQPPTVRGFQWSQPATGMTHLVARALTKVARAAGLSGVATPRAAEFGMFVRMVKAA